MDVCLMATDNISHALGSVGSPALTILEASNTLAKDMFGLSEAGNTEDPVAALNSKLQHLQLTEPKMTEVIGQLKVGLYIHLSAFISPKDSDTCSTIPVGWSLVTPWCVHEPVYIVSDYGVIIIVRPFSIS